MTTYFLQLLPDEDRQIIDTEVDPKNELKGSVEASSWVEAKRQFGYPLTKRQENMLS